MGRRTGQPAVRPHPRQPRCGQAILLSIFLIEHDLFGKPVSTFPDHAPGDRPRMRKLPPLNAVRTFEAAARHVSFTNAAEELHVTHGAVSRQVALLEQWFGIKLFRRGPSQLSLTEAGQTYYREVTAILDRLALASMDMKDQAAPTVLRINAPPTFTMRWLLGRI